MTSVIKCRVCLNETSDYNSLFDEVEYDKCIKLGCIFQKVTNILVLDDESTYSHLCQDCTERLLSAYEFICAVEKAELEMDNYLAQDVVAEDVELREEESQEHGNDMDIHEIEVLDEEFLLGNELVDTEPVNDAVVEDDIVAENSSIVTYDKYNKPQKNDVEKKSIDLVGSRLSKRRQSSNYVKCSSCQRSFAKKETLERHVKIAHTVIPIIPLQSANKSNNFHDKMIYCRHCPQFFKRRINYIRHLMNCHSKEAEYLTPEDYELVKSKQNYKRGICPHCGKSFTQASLIIHIRRHTGENPYPCDQCEKAYPRRQDLKIHQRQHTGEKPHLCPICGKSFSRANKLARHMRIHTGERPYKCTECDRSFSQSNDLKIHTRRHTGEKPYKCSVCAEAFICGSALKTHRRQKDHHSPDDECDDPFANWRVSKRKVRTDANLEANKDTCYEDKTTDYLSQNTTDIDEPCVKMEIIEITPG